MSLAEAAFDKEGGASRDEAAAFLGVSLSTVKRMLRDGELTKKKIRGRTVIPWVELRDRVASRIPAAYEAKPEPKDGDK